MSSNIIPQIRTVPEQTLFEESIDILISGLYESDMDMGELIDKSFTNNIATEIKSELSAGDIKKSENYLRDLKKQVGELEKLGISLAINPTAQVLSYIYNFVTKAIGSPVVLEVSVEPHIVGGAKISFRGKYSEYTIADVVSRGVARNARTPDGANGTTKQ